MSDKDILKEDVLGKGAFATVFKAKVKSQQDGVRNMSINPRGRGGGGG